MKAQIPFEKLLEPAQIGKVRIRNRMVKTAAESCYYDEKDGYITDACKAFYETLAKGGVGLIIVESAQIDYPQSLPQPHGFRIDDDKYISGLSDLTRCIHQHGCPVFLQLLHGGPWHRTEWFGLQPVAASSRPEGEFPGHDAPRALSIPEIESVIDQFADAAERAKKAGFDGVDINAGASHLLSTFLSRHWNKRQDPYGCENLETRSRIVVKIIKAIKKRCEQDFPVGVLFNGLEFGSPDGMTIEESKGFAKIFQSAGATSVQIRCHGFGTMTSLWPEHLFYPEFQGPKPDGPDWSSKGAGAYIPLAAAIKEVVSIPVVSVGRLDPILGEQALQEGLIDFVGMTRRLLADPELPNKVISGNLEDIAPCTACLCCLDRAVECKPVRCRINASLGRGQEYQIKYADKRKRVLVVGGGPAGMESSRVAALRGHEVLLYERESGLGGLLPIASLVKGFDIEDLEAIIDYFKAQFAKLDITLRLGKEVDLATIEEIKPDVLILAAGGIPTLPRIPGINGHKVVSGSDLFRRVRRYQKFFSPRILRWLTKLWMPLGKNIVVVGGKLQACQLAEFLVKRRREVSIVSDDVELGEGIGPLNKMSLFGWLIQNNVTMIENVTFNEINEKGLSITKKEGSRQIMKADTLISAMPLSPNHDIPNLFEGKVLDTYSIGDCSSPGLIIDAISEGARVAHLI